MQKEIISVTQNDGYITSVTAYFSDTPPFASLLILHGMAEHHKRYDAFASFLCKNGIDVYLYDHRGHGTSLKESQLGYIASSGGYRLLISDGLQIAAYIRLKKRCNSFFIMGHSMGSLITRCILQKDNTFSGAIICGTTCPSRSTIQAGLYLTDFIKRIYGSKHRCPFMNHLLFESKKFSSLSDHTNMDWLTRDEKIVQEYIQDPYCGFLCTISFYHDLIRLSDVAGRPENILQIRKDLPLFFLSGAKDPVSNYGKEILTLTNFLKKNRYCHLKRKLYPNCRHELLNELNKEEIINDIQMWIQTHSKD